MQEGTLADHPAEWRQEMATLRAELEAFVTTKVHEAQDVHINLRLWGVVCLLVGIAVMTVGNLI